MAHEATQCLFTSKRDFLLYSRTAYVVREVVSGNDIVVCALVCIGLWFDTHYATSLQLIILKNLFHTSIYM